VDGNQVRLTDLRGKVVVVSFWGTWCPPCRASLPHEREMIEREYKGRPLTILGVAADPPDQLREFLKANPLPWQNIVDPQRTLSEDWGIRGYPSAILVDHRGVIRRVWKGGLNPGELREEIARLVDRAERD
jgi:peroxiredoxin